jgi:hypothetical protein
VDLMSDLRAGVRGLQAEGQICQVVVIDQHDNE